MNRILLIAVIVLLAVSVVWSAEEGAQIKQVREIASQSLAQFSQLVMKHGNYREMGFESREELNKMALGSPLKEFRVGLDQLKKYEKGMSPDGLLTDTRHYLYPIQVVNQVRSSLSVAETKDGWKAVSFGSPGFVKMVSRARTKSAESTNLSPEEYFLVEIPALNLFFLGHRSQGMLMLTPTTDDKTLEFQAGVPLPAEKVLLSLVPAAREHNGLPR